MIKLFTLVHAADPAACITPPDRALSLTVSRPVAHWSTMPDPVFGGAIECAAYASLADLLAGNGCASVAEVLAVAPRDRTIVEENLIMPGAVPAGPGAIKLTSLIGRKPGMTRAEFRHYYPTNHAPLVRQTPELPRYAQNYAIYPEDGSPEPRFDAVAELWWPDRETAIRSWSSPQIQVDQARDCTNFIGDGVTLFGDIRRIV